MREDCYAAYACGHVEFDISTLNVGEASYCNACQQPQVIVARTSTNGPRQPLEEKEAEIERLRTMLAYVARCLSASEFCEADREYAGSLASYITKRIPPTELTDEFVSEQSMERVYDAVQASLDEEERKDAHAPGSA